MSNFKKEIFLSTISSFVGMSLLFGQNASPKVINIPSPNTASLGIYGENPVSKFTGIPSVNIPLNNINTGDVSLPINLSYHVGSNRIDQHPGWVGLGWSLDCSGVISRVVKNYPDEFAYTIDGISYVPPVPDGKFGYYHNTSFLSTSNWQTPAGLVYNPTNQNPNFMIPDLEPDEFSFNFSGNSGKFFLNHEGTWKVISDKPIKVDFEGGFVNPFIRNHDGYVTNNDLTPTFKRFKITDEYGNQYFFGSLAAGDNDDAIEYGMPMSNSPSRYSMFTASAWYLTKVVLATGAEQIIYNYKRGPFTSNIMFSGAIGTNSANSPARFPIEGSYSCFSSGSTNGTPFSINLEGSYNAPVYLKEIIYPSKNLKIKFNTSRCNDMGYPKEFYSRLVDITNNNIFWYLVKMIYASGLVSVDGGYNPNVPPRDLPDQLFFWLQLNSIEFQKNSDGSQLSKVTFIYDDGGATQRLRPVGVNIAGKTPDAVQKYSFEYYNHLAMPSYLFGITDHWGYWTGVVPITLGSLPASNLDNMAFYLNNYFNDLTSPISALRAPNLNGTLAGALKTITYPTGGSTLFEYELNDYGQHVNSNNRSLLHTVPNTLAGGLRVKKITNSSPLQTPHVREFFYKSNFISSPSNPQGLSSSGILNVLPRYQSVAATTSHLGVTVFTTSTSFSPVIPLTYNSSGSHIGYSEVTEKATSNGFTISKFTNHHTVGSQDLAPLNSDFLDFEPVKNYSSMAHNRGLPILEEVYNQSNELVKKTEMEYDIIGDVNTDFCRAYKHKTINFCQPTQTPIWVKIPYKVPYYKKMLIKKTDYIKNQANNSLLKTEENYTYATGNFKLLKTITTNTSAGNQQKVELSYPFNSTLAPYPEMTSLNMVAPVIEKLTTMDNQIILNETNKYKKWSPNVFALENLKFKKGSTGEQVTKMTYLDYDDKGNPLLLTNGQEINTFYIWGYNKQYPVAKVIGATNINPLSLVNQAVINNPSSDEVMRTELNNIRTGLANTSAQVYTYTYSPLIGITSETDANNYTKYYEYDSFNRLALIRDKDNNILKRFCYNYKGQPINCCVSTAPDWQNTTLPPTCIQGTCGNTGYQLQQQMDMNTCSSTAGATRTINVYNPTACSMPTNVVNITYQNIGLSGYVAQYTNSSGTYTFNIPATPNTGVLGCLPPGKYILTVFTTPQPVMPYVVISNGCNSVSGSGASFNIGTTSVTLCSSISIND
jgi:hypothetical protein